MSGDSDHVVIVGGGFAGLGCARRLAKHDDVAGHADRPQQLPPVPAAALPGRHLAAGAQRHRATRCATVFADQDNVDVKLAEISADRLAARSTVRSTDGDDWTADALVLAAGSQPNFFGTPGAAENSFPLYSLDDATRLRSRILGLFEQVDRDPELVRPRRAELRDRRRGPDRRRGRRRDRRHGRPITVPAEYRDFDDPARRTSTCSTTATRC